jgi:hypothetical protein
MLYSSIYGGNLILPVAKDFRNERNIYNSVEEDILNMKINHLYGGGFYKIDRMVCNSD